MVTFEFESLVDAMNVRDAIRRAGYGAVVVWPQRDMYGWVKNCMCGEHFVYYLAVSEDAYEQQ